MSEASLPSPPPAAAPAVDPRLVQHYVDQAAYFNLISVPDPSGSAIKSAGGVIGIRAVETLHRLQVETGEPTATEPSRATNTVGEPLARMEHRWMLAPDDFVGAPDREPPATRLDPSRSQRFVMLDGKCSFGDGADGFYGFGSGQTHPTVVNGQSQVLATAVGTILRGFGKFEGYEEGIYVYCGSIDPDRGLTGNMLLRVRDPKLRLQVSSLPNIAEVPKPEPGITYLVLRGEAVPTDPVAPYIGPEGKPIGLIVKQGLTLQSVDSALVAGKGIGGLDRVGKRIGEITAYVAFDPASAVGSALDPVPFTDYYELAFNDAHGQEIGKIIADTSDGRVFNTKVSGLPAIRFGGVGLIRGGEGPFAGIEGLITDNSLVVFQPHVSASIYLLRVPDPHGRFLQAAGSE